MAKTGEVRKAKQPFNIDRLPPYVREAIDLLRNTYGKTWEQIEALSAQPFDAKLVPLGCFVDWDKLDTEVLALFPKRHIPRSNLQRYDDVRVQQVRAEVLRRSTQARVIARSFAKAAAIDGADEAVIAAARDTILGMLTDSPTEAGRKATADKLLALAAVQQKVQTNKIRERIVSVDERRIAQLEKDAEIRRARMDAETAKLTKKATKGEVTPEDIDRLRERVFGLPPKPRTAA